MSEQQVPDNGKLPPLPLPIWPKLDLPDDPTVPHNAIPNQHRMSGDAIIETYPDPEKSPIPPPAPGVRRILIGIPLLAITYEFFESFLKFWSEMLMSGDKTLEVGYQIAFRKPVHMAEEFLVKTAQYNKCTHILLMDDDIYDINKADLYKLLNADKDCISGVMHASKFPHAMCVFRRYDTDRKVIDMPVDTSIYRLYEIPCYCDKCKTPQSHWDAKHCINCGAPQNNVIQQADLTPFPFTMIKMSVFDKVKKPWFHCTEKYPTDSWFADRLIEAGMTMHAHMGVRLNHAGITDETKPHYMQMGMVKANKAKGVVHLSPEMMDQHQRMLMNKMWEAEAKMKTKPTFSSEGKASINPPSEDKGLTLVTHGVQAP